MATDLDLPIVYGIHIPTGELRHVTEVANGKACKCVCPDPHCGQRLIARNAGTKRIAHFAHESGSCTWSAEYLISMLAVEVLRKSGFVMLPRLAYYDAEKDRDQIYHSARRIPIANAELREISGRRAQDAVVAWRSNSGAERSLAIVFQLRHTVTNEQVGRLAEHMDGVIVIDMRSHMRATIRGMANRHYDRMELLTRYQDAELISSILLEDEFGYKTWEYSSLANQLHTKSVERMRLAREKERTRQEAEDRKRKAEEERLRKERDERATRKAEEKRRLKEARRIADERRKKEELEFERMRQELREEAARIAAEMQRREEAMRAENDSSFLPSILPLIDQQEKPAEDEFGRRWVRCEVCGKVAPERDFSKMAAMVGLTSEPVPNA